MELINCYWRVSAIKNMNKYKNPLGPIQDNILPHELSTLYYIYVKNLNYGLILIDIGSQAYAT